jgi:hypothetical protein
MSVTVRLSTVTYLGFPLEIAINCNYRIQRSVFEFKKAATMEMIAAFAEKLSELSLP